MEGTIDLKLTVNEVRTINGIARTCREFAYCGMLSGDARFTGLRKDLNTIIAKCGKALDDRTKARCV